MLINTLSSGAVLCNEVLHQDFEYRSAYLGLLDRLSGQEWLAVHMAKCHVESEILSRIARLGGIGGEW